MSVEKCQGCAYLNPKMFHCGKYLRGIETAIYLCQKEYKQTNADRIRSMTDEELAEYLFFRGNGQEYCYGICSIQNECETYHPDEECIKHIVKWLKQEATDAGT